MNKAGIPTGAASNRPVTVRLRLRGVPGGSSSESASTATRAASECGAKRHVLIFEALQPAARPRNRSPVCKQGCAPPPKEVQRRRGQPAGGLAEQIAQRCRADHRPSSASKPSPSGGGRSAPARIFGSSIRQSGSPRDWSPAPCPSGAGRTGRPPLFSTHPHLIVTNGRRSETRSKRSRRCTIRNCDTQSFQ